MTSVTVFDMDKHIQNADDVSRLVAPTNVKITVRKLIIHTDASHDDCCLISLSPPGVVPRFVDTVVAPRRLNHLPSDALCDAGRSEED